MRNRIMTAYFAIIAILTFPLVNGQVSGISEKDDIISSATFPSSYGNDIEATHSISVLPRHFLSISFIEFYLEYKSNCGYDSLKIVDTSGKDLFFGCGQMHGLSVPAAENFPPLIETSLGVTIIFKTDGSVTQKGFQLKVQQLGITNQCGTPKKKRSLRTSRAAEGNPILFLGPGYSSGQSEAYTLPTDGSPMTKASCTVPTYPLPGIYGIYGAVGFVTPKGLELCGGYSSGSPQSACYSLKDSAWTASTPTMVPRYRAAAARLASGDILVTGGYGSSYLQSSELLTGTTWTAALELPSARYGHCLLQLSSGGLYLHGGNTGNTARDTYISADLTSWTPRVSSSTARESHTCIEVTFNNDVQVWLGGGWHVATTEIYNVAQDGYTSGPNLPNYYDYPGELVAHAGQVYYAGGESNKNIYQLKDGWTQQDAWTKIGEMSQTRRIFPALIISLETCKGIKPTPTPTPMELSYNHDGSVGYVSGTLTPIVTQLASESPESHAVRCCGGVYGNTTTTTCGNGISCTDICGSKNSGCVTVICEECHTSSAEHQVCDKPMQEMQWCANAETIQGITNQCGTLKKKRSLRTTRAAWGITTLILNINYCPRKCRNLAALHRMPLCCLHPYVRRAIKGAQKDCCTRHGLCP